MQSIDESIMYLRGLIDGSGYDEDTKEGRIFDSIVDILEDMRDQISTLSSRGVYCEDMLEDLLDEKDAREFDEFDEDDFVEITCPNCHDVVMFDKDTYNSNENLICPNCSQPV